MIGFLRAHLRNRINIFFLWIIYTFFLGSCNELTEIKKMQKKMDKVEKSRVDNSDLDSLMKSMDTSGLKLKKIE